MKDYDSLKTRLAAVGTGPQNGTRAEALEAINDLEQAFRDLEQLVAELAEIKNEQTRL